MSVNWRIVDWKLKNKVILHISVIGLFSVSTLAVLFLNAEKVLIHSLANQKSELVGNMIDCNVRHQMIKGDTEAIGINLVRLTESSSIKRLRILDINGKILNSSDPAEKGGLIPARDSARLQQLFRDRNPVDLFSIKQVSRVKSYVALRNRAECSGCHAPENPYNGILEVDLDESLEARLMARNRIQGVLIALATLAVLTFIIVRLYERVINRPLMQLKESMSLVQGGDLEPRIEPPKKDEFGDLAHSFNAMVGRLQEANQEIEALHSRQMERAGHLASLGELAAGLAHEIKNPIAGIKGSLEIIKDRTPPSDPQREIFGEILTQTERIHHIIQDLLDYAKPKELAIQPVNPNICVQEAIQLAGPQVQDKDIRIEFSRLDRDIVARCDSEKIKGVILNLLINGIAAIEKAGEISVALSLMPENTLEVNITDNGRGIKPEFQGKIFQPFFTTRKKGTGLGLSICKQIVEAHNGTLTVVSAPGEGSTFTIRLPLDKEPTDLA
jgi:signal transduction histidine kinase